MIFITFTGTYDTPTYTDINRQRNTGCVLILYSRRLERNPHNKENTMNIESLLRLQAAKIELAATIQQIEINEQNRQAEAGENK